jgi:predicted cobalt transporter CbtA
MSSTRTQRIIAFILLISPWIYLPTAIKEIIFIALAVILYLSTVPLYKKHKTEYDAEGDHSHAHAHTHTEIHNVTTTAK